MNISFRPITEIDFNLLFKWLTTDFVKEWYQKKDISFSEVEEKYRKYITKEKPTDGYIIQINNIAVGYIQTYLIKDYPDYNKYIQANDGSSGLDLFIGEIDYINKGLGKQIVRQFMKEVIFSKRNISDCIIGPEPNNVRAIKTYTNAGFKYIKTIQIPDEDAPEYLMQIKSEEFELLIGGYF